MDNEQRRTGAPVSPVVVTLPDEIDAANADSVGDELRAAFAPGVAVVIADLSATVYCDSSGLRNFALAHAKAVASDAELRLAAASPAVRHVLDLMGFDELLKISDYISIHTPLLPATHHLFNADVLRRMKPTAYLINTARGPIIDEAALASALEQGHLAGAALDVMTQEPPSGSPLFGRDNVIVTPHTSFYSEESLVDLQTKAAEEVVRVLSGQAPRNPVNPEALKTAQAI